MPLPNYIRFYYADASVICEPYARGDSFQEKPVVIVEVLSRSTRRLDLDEKKDAYLSLPSLRVYLLVEQEAAKIVAFRREGDDFVREVFEGRQSVVPLPEIGAQLAFDDVCETAMFTPEAIDRE